MSTILVIDPEPSILSSLEKILREDCHEVVTAASVPEALAALRKHQPDVVLLDAGPAGSPAPSALEDLSRRLPGTPVIVMTDQDTAEAAIEAICLGAYDSLRKPFRVPDLQSRIRKALASS